MKVFNVLDLWSGRLMSEYIYVLQYLNMLYMQQQTCNATPKAPMAGLSEIFKKNFKHTIMYAIYRNWYCSLKEHVCYIYAHCAL